MTIFDYLVLGVLAVSTVVGMLRGLAKEVLSLVSWLVALIVANVYSQDLAPMLPEVIPGPTLRMMVAFLALFIAARLLMWLVNMMFDAIIKASGLSPVDRGLGAVFGLARGVMMVMVAVMICGMTAIPQQPFWKEATLSPLAESAVREAKPFLPESIARFVTF